MEGGAETLYIPLEHLQRRKGKLSFSGEAQDFCICSAVAERSEEGSHTLLLALSLGRNPDIENLLDLLSCD